jgi:hypothetical protein
MNHHAGAAASSRMSGVGDGNEIFPVAIFRFNEEHINEAMEALRALVSA